MNTRQLLCFINGLAIGPRRLELKPFNQVVFTVKQEDLSLNQAPVYSGLYRPSLQQEGEGQSL